MKSICWTVLTLVFFTPAFLTSSFPLLAQENKKVWYTYWQNAKRPLPKQSIPDLTFDIPQVIDQYSYSLKSEDGKKIPIFGANRFTSLSKIGTASGGSNIQLGRFRVFNYRNYFEIEQPESFEPLKVQEAIPPNQNSARNKTKKVWVLGSDILASPKK